MISIEELQRMTEKELTDEVRKTKIELFKIRLAVQSRQSKDSAKLKVLRKYLARIKTITLQSRKINAKREVVTQPSAGQEA